MPTKHLFTRVVPALCVGVLALSLGLFAGRVCGQQFKEASRFTLPEYYPPPNETQMKMLLEGAKAKPLDPDNKHILFTDAKVQNFRTNGTGEMVVQAPQCFYDAPRQTISSDGPLHAHTADGQFFIDGTGFLWEHAKAHLIVSNQVHTVIHPDALGAGGAGSRTNPPPDEAKAIDILSEWFDYDVNASLGLYLRNVRLTGTNLSLTGDLLRVASSLSERRLESILAETNVIVNYTNADLQEIRATGERASYLPASELIELSGAPTWSTGPRSGRGDEITLDRTNRILLARGNAYLKMPNPGGASFLPQLNAAPAGAPAGTNQFVEFFSDHYVIQTNLAVFSRAVLVRELLGEELRGKLTCSNTLTVTFTGTNQMESMTAEDQVVMEQEDKQLTGERAVYTATNGLMTLTGNPAWRAGPRDGNGDLVLVRVAENEMIVSGNASMRMPAGQLSHLALTGTNSSQAAEANLEGKLANVTSEDYQVKPGNAHFLRQVRVEHPDMKLKCEDLSVDLPASGGQVTNLVARQAVEFELTDERGQKVQGTGAQAVYTFDVANGVTNSIVVLTGDPVLVTTNHTFRNNPIIYDLANSRLIGPGKYQFRGVPNPGATNTFMAKKRRAR